MSKERVRPCGPQRNPLGMDFFSHVSAKPKEGVRNQASDLPPRFCDCFFHGSPIVSGHGLHKVGNGVLGVPRGYKIIRQPIFNVIRPNVMKLLLVEPSEDGGIGCFRAEERERHVRCLRRRPTHQVQKGSRVCAIGKRQNSHMSVIGGANSHGGRVSRLHTMIRFFYL